MAPKHPKQEESPFAPSGDLEDESKLDEVLIEEMDERDGEDDLEEGEFKEDIADSVADDDDDDDDLPLKEDDDDLDEEKIEDEDIAGDGENEDEYH